MRGNWEHATPLCSKVKQSLHCAFLECLENFSIVEKKSHFHSDIERRVILSMQCARQRTISRHREVVTELYMTESERGVV